ncbi:ISAs1 family transposase [Acidocella aquatica]|uniref:ISAs1 family transposase n=1 Tax=Acidocella aquatica TaxID=1922313 RepID=UPI0024E0FE54|nr:ISAs1 family transposase [Acidocella aquatica]
MGFYAWPYPCHATLTETLRVLDALAVADILGAVVMADNGDDRHIAIDGKTLRASKDVDGRAEHVLSAFCGGLQTNLSHEASRGKGLEIPDALKLLARLDLRDRIITGDAIFCQKSITQAVVDGGGDYLLPIKNNQKTLRENIETAFAEPVFPPRHQPDHRRSIARRPSQPQPQALGHRDHASKQRRHARRRWLHQPARQRTPKCLLAHRPRPQNSAMRLSFTHKGNRAFPGQPKPSHTNDRSG